MPKGFNRDKKGRLTRLESGERVEEDDYSEQSDSYMSYYYKDVSEKMKSQHSSRLRSDGPRSRSGSISKKSNSKLKQAGTGGQNSI